ncbi:TetR/AcrR family transcriptional regulator [Sinorhizobium sp. NFACC03]|uniref:TetR/AcrR family transcriptional regulator n=1 Tax=Sinorhizobium sp. NFACC03 TaxID=1566295 RepID=UPI00088D5909|nr:TetR/AcrR family transcriptional regulator [Sinorhizobium sp. NFACC03]SDA99892.1 transcriptional regulator, TetR family [Sinorhizobium sp. NFACC03]
MPKIVAERADVIPSLAEIFREFGFDGASLSTITEKTGLGKGSLYHFFPGGKEEMAAAVLGEIDQWFATQVFEPLRGAEDPRSAIAEMCRSVSEYFRSGRRVCLVGAFALDNVRNKFSDQVRDYFTQWRGALAEALERAGCSPQGSLELAEETVIAVQGALVLARALDEPEVFERNIDRLRQRLLAATD